ncbi:MAG TPA: type II secretion system protein F [Lachnospiraceae bacterium]|nr:type II secretion system protein F [Lachnospiraceae bacterium]
MRDWIISLAICWGIGYLFYKSIAVMILFSIGALLLVHIQIGAREKRKKWQLTLQFKDGIISLSNALTAGYSIENAFDEAVKDLCFLYETDAEIVKEFQQISLQVKLNRNVEELLLEFGNRSHIEDVINFAEIVTTAKRTGGDLIKIMKSTSNNISEKIEVQREITTLVAAKKLEGNIMSVIPLGIITYLNLSMPGFLEPMYQGVIGRGVMSISLFCYLAALLLLNKIVTIKV